MYIQLRYISEKMQIRSPLSQSIGNSISPRKRYQNIYLPIPNKRKGIILWRGPYARPISEQKPYEKPIDMPTLPSPIKERYP